MHFIFIFRRLHLISILVFIHTINYKNVHLHFCKHQIYTRGNCVGCVP